MGTPLAHRTTAVVLTWTALLGMPWHIALAQTAPGAGPTPAVSPVAIDRLAAIDMAGRQRMLAQRMTKAWMQRMIGVEPEQAQAMLQASVERFASQLASLRPASAGSESSAAWTEMQAQWRSFQALLEQPGGRAIAADLYDASEALQRAAHHATLTHDRAGGPPLEHLVNLAGRQRMLSQRMAKFYLYRAADVLADPAEMELHLSRAHFTAVLLQIERSPHVGAAVRDAVLRVRQQWIPYEQALFTHRDPARMRAGAARVTGGSERVLAALEDLVTLIVAEGRGASR
jgi:hypothetical protein